MRIKSRVHLISLLFIARFYVILSRFVDDERTYLIESDYDKVDTKLSPVILIPGDGGNQVEVKINKPNVVHYWCKQTNDFFNIWLNLELLLPLVIDCWIDNFKLSYNNITRTTSNQPGVEIRIPGWGTPDVVEWLDPSHASPGAYFKDIGNALVNIGYVRNVSLRGAPYDFRRGPNENGEYFKNLKTLIEETYAKNNNTPVTIIAHSMGGPMSLVFLQMQNKNWKQKYIARLISLAGAWAGSIKALKAFAMGDNLGSWFLYQNVMRQEQITSPSLSYLLPSPLFWKNDEILVKTSRRAYTYGQMEEFFNDLNYRTGWEMRKDVNKFVTNFAAPDVELHCLYGNKINTIEKIKFTGPTIGSGKFGFVYGDGDGTVNLRSLEACKKWETMQSEPIHPVPMANAEHIKILSDANVIKYIVDVLKPH